MNMKMVFTDPPRTSEMGLFFTEAMNRALAGERVRPRRWPKGQYVSSRDGISLWAFFADGSRKHYTPIAHDFGPNVWITDAQIETKGAPLFKAFRFNDGKLTWLSDWRNTGLSESRSYANATGFITEGGIRDFLAKSYTPAEWTIVEVRPNPKLAPKPEVGPAIGEIRYIIKGQGEVTHNPWYYYTNGDAGFVFGDFCYHKTPKAIHEARLKYPEGKWKVSPALFVTKTGTVEAGHLEALNNALAACDKINRTPPPPVTFNFMEALNRLKAGKRVRRNSWDWSQSDLHIYGDGISYVGSEPVGARISKGMIDATDWVVVEV